MIVLFVSDHYNPHDSRFMRAIQDQGHEVYYLEMKSDRGSFQKETPLNLFPSSFLESASQFKSEIINRKIDVVHIGPISPSITFLRKALPDHTPIVGMSWAWDLLYRNRLEGDLNWIEALKSCDQLITDAKCVSKEAAQLVPSLKTKTHCFPWGLEFDRFPKGVKPAASLEIRKKLTLEEKTVLISTRSWEPVYCIEGLLLRFHAWLAFEPSLHLILTGDGSLREKLHTLIHQLKIENSVTLTGRISEEEVPTWMNSADLYVSSSLCDGTSISLLEAMACQLPAICHPSLGNLEWFKNGLEGWEMDFSKEPLHAKAEIKSILQKRSDWVRMGQSNRRLVEQLADWKVNSPQLSEIYRLAIQDRNASIGGTAHVG
jgi:L-malate glycosyltransferase